MSSRRKQTLTDRLRRLDKGCCPVHGIPMYQVDNMESLYVAECPRKDCTIRGTTAEPRSSVASDNGPYVKLVDFIRLFRHASGTPQKA